MAGGTVLLVPVPAATWAGGEVVEVVVRPRRGLPAGVTAEVVGGTLEDAPEEAPPEEVPPDDVPPDEGAELAGVGPSPVPGDPGAPVPEPRAPCVALGSASGGLAGTVVVVAAAVRGGDGAWVEVDVAPLLGGELE